MSNATGADADEPGGDGAEDGDDGAPILEFYDGEAAVLAVLGIEDSDGLAVLALDPERPDETVVTEYGDLDTALEANAERIEQLFAAAPATAADATVEQVWNAATLLISPTFDPLIVARNDAGVYLLLDPVETQDGRPGDRGSFDEFIDAVWAGIELVFGPDEDDEGDEGDAPPANDGGTGEVPPG